MGSSDRLFNRQRSIHQLLGGGLVADVVLWRRKNVSLGILLVALAAWVVFERSGYTLLSLVSSVLLLLVSILYLWSKSAALLNRPAPPLPDLYVPEEMVNQVAGFIRNCTNSLLSVSQDIALGKDSRMFFKVAACLWLISIVGGLTDCFTLGYTSLVIILTVPIFYETNEDCIDRYVMLGYRKMQQLYVRLDAECFSRIRKWVLEIKKLS